MEYSLDYLYRNKIAIQFDNIKELSLFKAINFKSKYYLSQSPNDSLTLCLYKDYKTMCLSKSNYNCTGKLYHEKTMKYNGGSYGVY